jgi:hypothetical protein
MIAVHTRHLDVCECEIGVYAAEEFPGIKAVFGLNILEPAGVVAVEGQTVTPHR